MTVRPKRLFHAIVVCGVALSCGGVVRDPDEASTSMPTDASNKKDNNNQMLQGDAADAGTDDVMEASKFDGPIIVPPIH